MKVRFSTLKAGCLLLSRKIPGTHFCQRLSRLQGHCAAGKITSIEEIGLIGNRTRDLPACSIVPQPDTLLRVRTNNLVRFFSINYIVIGTCFILVSGLTNSSTLKMEATCSSETSIDFQCTTRRYIPEDRTIELQFLLKGQNNHQFSGNCLRGQGIDGQF
jgi:hypothetical protein